MRRLCYILVASVIISLFGACAGGGKKSDTYAVSFPSQSWLLRQLAGDSVQIVSLLPPGTDPETYQPSMSTLKAVGDAKAYFTLGSIGFESSLAERLASNFPDLQIIDSSIGLKKIYGTHEHARSDRHDDNTEAFDPHLLTSVRNVIDLSNGMAKELIRINPQDESSVSSRLAALLPQLRQIDDSIRHMDISGKAFLIRHPSLSYFARDYGLRQIALEEDGKEPTPAQLAERVAAAISGKASVMVIEKEHASPRDKELAASLGIPVVEVSLNSETWLSDLMRIANSL